ncbi:MAG: response regulator [Rhodocyclaceae bacterium]|nr:response regulator [Rhodocyclaceae bacterium]MDZ4214914.1 response regulator [Rhodocyclaceae bacterium]
MRKITSQALRVVALGYFADSIPPLAPRLAALNVAPLRIVSVEQLPGRLDDHDILLTELRWLNSLSDAQRDELAGKVASAAGWIVLTDPAARFKDQVTWQRLGVRHFFQKPLNPERLAGLVEDVHDRLAGAPIRAILLDDDASSLSFYGEVLRHAGIQVLATQDPLLVIESLDEHQPDVLVLDIEMPGCRGPELATIVRQHPAYARLPVIFLTASQSMQDKLLARAAAAEDFLTKPVAAELLLAAVESHALRYRAFLRSEQLKQQQQAQARLRLEQLRQAVDEHAIVSVADAKGKIVHVNDRFCAISGYTREELLGQNHRMVKSGLHEAAFYNDLWSSIVSGRVWHGEVCNRRKNGEIYWVEATIYPVLDSKGVPAQYISIRTDITALKATQAALHIGEERLRRGQEFANIGTWEWAIETGELFWSERIGPLFGYSVGELATSYENFLGAIHPDDRQPVIDAVGACIERDAPYDIEHRVVWPDGTVRWLLERGAVSRDAHGKPLKMLGVVQDIDDRKRAELNLILARETAERANQSKSDFLSSMSHELRTPMNAIIGFAQMLEYDSEMTADQQDNVHEILKAGRHLLDLINEVLDLAKIESGRIELSMEGVDLHALAEDCRHLIQPIADKAGISLSFDLPAERAVFADRVRLKQVLLNLLSNAIKYNRPDGSVRLTAAAAAKPGHLRIVVADTGHGIPPERIGDLFQPFNRLGAEAGEIEGTGIGLTITRRLVDMMGGEMGVDSTLGVGSSFWLELALGQTANVGAGKTAAESINASESPQREAKVLAIDDNPANLKLIAQVMGLREHVHLLTAHTPELGIELALAHRPDLILLDINMPGMDGYQVLKVFQASAELRHIPVVAITANAMPRDIERGKAAGFTDYLTKPLDIGHFLQVADALLDAATTLPPEQP